MFYIFFKFQIGSHSNRLTGLLAVDQGQHPSVESLQSIGSQYRTLSPAELAAEFPTLKFTEEFLGTYDYDGGVIHADKALKAYQVILINHWNAPFECHVSLGSFAFCSSCI